MADQRWWSSGRRRTRDDEEARQVGYRVHALPRAERGNIQYHHRTNPDPTRWRVPILVNARSPAGPGGGPETFQETHRTWGPERGP